MEWYVFHQDIISFAFYTSPIYLLGFAFFFIKSTRAAGVILMAVYVVLNGIQYNLHTGFEPLRLAIGLGLILFSICCIIIANVQTNGQTWKAIKETAGFGRR